MQERGSLPASRIPIKALIALSFSVYPQPRKNFDAVHESLLRIGLVALKVKSHGAVHLHHRRRGFLARKGSGIGGFGRAAASPWLQGPASQARPLSQSRSRHDVAVSARRSLRDG